MSTKNAAFGVILKAAATAAPTAVVPGLRTIGFNGGDRVMIDATTRDDTTTKSYIPHPLREVRSISGSLAYDPDDVQQERMRAAHAAGTKEYVSLFLPAAGGPAYALAGNYTKWSLPELAQDGILEVVFEFMATGAETFTGPEDEE